jgi:NADH dehydrogenase
MATAPGAPRALELLAGAVAGLLAAAVVGALMAAQGMTAADGAELGVVTFLALSVLAGAAFAAVFRHRPGGLAADVVGGLVAGFLWWAVRSLTLLPLLAGQPLTWSLAAATAAFPFLVGDLLFGALLGLGLHTLVHLYLRVRPGSAHAAQPQGRPTTRVVVLGGGFGGVAVAQELESRLAGSTSVEVTLVSDGNYLLFTPMLAEVASGSLEPRHISAPLRAACPRTVLRRAQVERIDTGARTVWLRETATDPAVPLPYDQLVLALGGVPDYRGLPGLAEHAFALKTLEDAASLRDHLIELLERADAETNAEERRRQLTVVVTGGGFAGAELVAELFDLVHGVLHRYPHLDRSEPRFVLVHSRDRILPEISDSLAAYALAKLRHKGIEFRLSRRVAALGAEDVELDDGERLPTRTLIWTAGNRPHPLLADLPFARNRAGAVVCDATTQVEGTPGVWAVGDCAAIPDPAEPGTTYPPTAQHALREGTVTAANIAAALQGQPPRPFRYRSAGTLVVLGHQQAVAEIRGLRFSGLVAWLLWRGIYLTKLPGLERKVRVLLDWTLDLVFPRDIVVVPPARRSADLPGGRERVERVQ